jgi:hypothetical protein
LLRLVELVEKAVPARGLAVGLCGRTGHGGGGVLKPFLAKRLRPIVVP